MDIMDNGMELTFDCGDLQPVLMDSLSDNLALVPLSDSQRKALQLFRSRIASSEYVEMPHPCLCGGTSDILIACKDRHGLPLRTVLCESCGLMRSDAYLSPDTLVKFYQNDYRRLYEKEAYTSSSALERMKTHGKHIYQLFIECNINIPKHVFEVGCGTGGNLIPFLLRDHIVHGCDYDRAFLEVGRDLGLDLYEGGLETLGEKLPYSLVILCHVIEHFWDPVSELNKLHTVLPEGSLVYIELPGIYSIHHSYRDPLLFLQNAHAYHFCLKTLDYVMSLSGFERVYGDERIRGIYRLNMSLKPISPDSELFRQILCYLIRVDRLKRFPNSLFWVQLALRLARKLGGSRVYKYDKKVYN